MSDRASVKVSQKAGSRIGYLPHGIVESNSDMELKPLWLTTSAQSQVSWVQLLLRALIPLFAGFTCQTQQPLAAPTS